MRKSIMTPVKVKNSATRYGSLTVSQPKAPMIELNEKIILDNFDSKKTYYNSILSHMKPKFKYLKRSGRNNFLDQDGNSFRDANDLSSVDFSYSNADPRGNTNRKSTAPGT